MKLAHKRVWKYWYWGMAAALLFSIGFLKSAPAQANPFQTRAKSPNDNRFYLWDPEAIDAPRYIQEFSDRNLALDPQGNPHIVYGGDHLYHAWYDGTAWEIEVVDAGDGVGMGAIIAFDDIGNMHVCYADSVQGLLKHAYGSGADWAIQTIAVVKKTYRHFSMDLDSAGQPHILYDDGTLKLASWDGAAWNYSDTQLASDQYITLALDSHDLPHIVYQRIQNGIW